MEKNNLDEIVQELHDCIETERHKLEIQQIYEYYHKKSDSIRANKPYLNSSVKIAIIVLIISFVAFFVGMFLKMQSFVYIGLVFALSFWYVAISLVIFFLKSAKYKAAMPKTNGIGQMMEDVESLYVSSRRNPCSRIIPQNYCNLPALCQITQYLTDQEQTGIQTESDAYQLYESQLINHKITDDLIQIMNNPDLIKATQPLLYQQLTVLDKTILPIKKELDNNILHYSEGQYVKYDDFPRMIRYLNEHTVS